MAIRLSVKISRGTFDLATDFEFQDMGGGREQLRFLNLSASEFVGAQVKVAVIKRGADGDGLVNVGYINGEYHRSRERHRAGRPGQDRYR
jgi:hypothetical protein